MLFRSRLAAGITILLAGLLGIFPPAFVAQVVAFAFGLAASTLFPVLFMGIFSKKTTKDLATAVACREVAKKRERTYRYFSVPPRFFS